MTDCAPDGDCPPARPARPIDPEPFDALSAAATTTPIAAYGTADAACARYGPRYFADDADLTAYIDRSDQRQTVYVWDLDRATGAWTRR